MKHDQFTLPFLDTTIVAEGTVSLTNRERTAG
jgi:hypothetical protein